MDSFLIVLGTVFAAMLTVGSIMGVLLWINYLYDRAEQHTRWKNRVSDAISRIESMCSRMENGSRERKEAKPRAKRK